MAYTAATLLNLTGMPPGRTMYRYDTTDHPDTVEAANYFNNLDNNLGLAVGDLMFVTQWSATPFAAGSTLVRGNIYAVSNVIANNAAAGAGRVNIAGWNSATGVISSLL